MHLPFQKLNKKIVWGRYIEWDSRHFSSFILRAHTFLLNQFIFFKEDVVATQQYGYLEGGVGGGRLNY